MGGGNPSQPHTAVDGGSPCVAVVGGKCEGACAGFDQGTGLPGEVPHGHGDADIVTIGIDARPVIAKPEVVGETWVPLRIAAGTDEADEIERRLKTVQEALEDEPELDLLT